MYGGYIYGGYPNYTMLFENISLFWKLEITLEENMGYLIHLSLFFQAGIRVPIVLDISDTCPFFSSLILLLLFMNNFCIAQCFFSATKLLRDSNKNLEHLFGGYTMKNIFVFTPSVGVYTKIWEEERGNSKLLRLCQSRNRLHKDRYQLIQMRH